MDAYNLTNGEHMTENRHLNVEVAKEQWHFQGVVMSDWVSVYDTAAAANAASIWRCPSLSTSTGRSFCRSSAATDRRSHHRR